jgi:4-amino-4-deoxy-L-arabinose transferase-like glycosyltransferase
MILDGDFFYLADQARDYLLTKDIIYNNHLTLIGTHSGLGGFFHGPLWLYMLVPVYLIGGGNPLIFAYFYILIALATVVTGFILGKKLYNTWIGILIAFILSISSSIWPYVPNTIGINPVPFVYLLIFYFLIKFIRGNNLSLVFATFFVGLTLQFETAAALVLLPVFVLSVLIFRLDVLKQIKIILLSIAAFVLSVSSFILFDLKHQFLMTKSLLGISSGLGKSNGYMEFPERLYAHLNSLKGVLTSVNFSNSLPVLIIVLLIMAFGIWSVWNKKKNNKTEIKEYGVLIFIPLVMFVFFLKYPYPIYHDYVLGLTIPMAFMVGLSVKNIWRYQLGKVLVITFIGVNSILAIQYLIPQYTAYSPNQTGGAYKNQVEIVDWIFEDSKGKEFGYFVYDPTTYTYGMNYLMEWKGEKTGYVPKSQKLPTTYLIMGKPLDNDNGAHAFWKKNVIKTTGRVVTRKEFKGGVVVEKLSVGKEEPEDPNYHQNLIFR